MTNVTRDDKEKIELTCEQLGMSMALGKAIFRMVNEDEIRTICSSANWQNEIEHDSKTVIETYYKFKNEIANYVVKVANDIDQPECEMVAYLGYRTGQKQRYQSRLSDVAVTMYASKRYHSTDAILCLTWFCIEEFCRKYTSLF